MPLKKSFVLDTSALFALRGDERGADRVQAFLSRAERRQCRVLVSFMTRMETLYLVRRDEGEEAAHEALRLMDSFSIEWIGCEAAILEKAAQIKSLGGISVADSWIAATASLFAATLVHKDPEFASCSDISSRTSEIDSRMMRGNLEALLKHMPDMVSRSESEDLARVAPRTGDRVEFIDGATDQLDTPASREPARHETRDYA